MTSRALDLLGAFDTAHPRMTLTEIAARPGQPMATAHRLVAELVGWGALAGGTTAPTRSGRLWALGLLAPVQGELREVAAPFLQDLYAATGDTVHLAVREGDARSTWSGSRATRPCRWSARSAAGCRCTPPAWARCCSPTPRPTSSSRCWAR